MTRPTRVYLGPAQRELRARQARRLIFFLCFGVATVGLFLGCGDRNLIMKVDVHSFLDASETEGFYGPVPAGLTGSTTYTTARDVNLLSGVEGIVAVESVDISLSGVFDNATGAGDALFVAVFRRPSGEAVDSLVVPVRLEPAGRDTLEAQLTGSAALAELLTGSQVRLDLRLDLAADAPPANLDPLAGEFALTRFLAVLVARRDTQ